MKAREINNIQELRNRKKELHLSLASSEIKMQYNYYIFKEKYTLINLSYRAIKTTTSFFLKRKKSPYSSAFQIGFNIADKLFGKRK